MSEERRTAGIRSPDMNPRAQPEPVESRERQMEAAAVEEAMEKGKARLVQKRQQAAGDVADEIFDASETKDAVRTADRSMRSQSLREEKHSSSDTDIADDARQRGRKKSRRLQEGDGKKNARLNFEESEDGMIRSGMNSKRHQAHKMALAARFAAEEKILDNEDENVAVEASKRAELIGEESVRRAAGKASSRLQRRAAAENVTAEEEVRSRLIFQEARRKETVAGKGAEAKRKGILRKFFQKQRIKRQYAEARYAEKTADIAFVQGQRFTTRVKAAVRDAFARKSRVFLILGILAVMAFLIMAAVSSCSASIHGMASSVISTTYPSTDEDIYEVNDAYVDMEERLNSQINRMESTHPEYDDYLYQIDEITHNPYHLISYFTVKYGEFTYRQVKDELEEIFREQYSLTTKGERGTVTQKKKVRVGESLGTVTTSGYCSCAICCGIWAGGPTASGKYPTSNHTIAVDATNPFVPMGTHVIMNGTEYVVEDTGAFARFGVQFDVYYGSHSAASAHGHKNWEAYLADSNGSKEIEVTTTETVNRLKVSMTNHDLDSVLRERMNSEEEDRYDLYNTMYGNRDYLFDLDKLPVFGGNGGGSTYQIPPEALSDKRFARMIHEAEKYLGYPYVWGGSSPAESFDCSGFVSWVINHCGNGWSVGRLGADGLRRVCVKVSPANAKPGDLIFFQNTYPCGPGASHVGIYVGNGMMIHCGNPIQYTSVKTAYWQQHFLEYGRIK